MLKPRAHDFFCEESQLVVVEPRTPQPLFPLREHGCRRPGWPRNRPSPTATPADVDRHRKVGRVGEAVDVFARVGPRHWHPLAAAAGPAARYLPGLTYDRRRDRLVLFGGGDPSSPALFADTWEFDGAAWQQLDP